MTYYEERINEFLNSRTCAALAVAVFVLASFLAFDAGHFTQPDTGNGIFYSLTDNLIANKFLSYGINVLAVLIITNLTMALNKVYNFVRSVTFVFAATFLALELGNPFVMTQFNTGTALILATVSLLFTLFSSYQKIGHSQNSIFLTFAALSFCCMFQYAFLVLVVAFAIGFFQMRSMAFRGILAMVIGMITPFWIMIGLGIVNPKDATPPQIETIWTELQAGQVQLAIAFTAAIAILAILLMMTNLLTIMNYRLQTRVYNSFIMTLTLVTIAMMCIDYRNMMIYVPLLNWCVAIQVTHTFTINRHFLRRYILVIAILAAAFGVYAGYLLELL